MLQKVRMARMGHDHEEDNVPEWRHMSAPDGIQGWKTMRDVSIDEISQDPFRSVIDKSTFSTIVQARCNRRHQSNKKLNPFYPFMFSEERNRLERFRNMMNQWEDVYREYIDLLQQYHEQQFLYRTNNVYDDAKISDIRNRINNIARPTYAISAHGEHIQNSLIVVPKNMIIIMSCERGNPHDCIPQYNIGIKNTYYYPGMLIDNMMFNWSFFQQKDDYAKWLYGGILLLTDIFDRKIKKKELHTLDSWNLGVDIGKHLSHQDKIYYELNNILIYNEDSIYHRKVMIDTMVNNNMTKLSDILKGFVKSENTPCTIVIQACRGYRNSHIIKTHTCGRYGPQSINPWNVTKKRSSSVSEYKKYLEEVVEYFKQNPRSLLLSLTEQGDLTSASGCFNIINNLTQAINHIYQHHIYTQSNIGGDNIPYIARDAMHTYIDWINNIHEQPVIDAYTMVHGGYNSWLNRMKSAIIDTDYEISYNDLCIVAEICDAWVIPPELILAIHALYQNEQNGKEDINNINRIYTYIYQIEKIDRGIRDYIRNKLSERQLTQLQDMKQDMKQHMESNYSMNIFNKLLEETKSKESKEPTFKSTKEPTLLETKSTSDTSDTPDTHLLDDMKKSDTAMTSDEDSDTELLKQQEKDVIRD